GETPPHPGVHDPSRASGPRSGAPRSPGLGGRAFLEHSFSQRQLRDAIAGLGLEVPVVPAMRPDGEPVGVTANSFSPVSLEPPLLLWCLASSSSGAPAFAPGAAFAVHVLAHEQRDLALHFARRIPDKFADDPPPR